ncbi:hypothetical protein [Streptomyces sp. NPDC096311]|uniref:hypothetical protein n=1 Tax=Streptomyces sp. NPDC096311 TaxID=3366083 RepID=UPI003814E243
MTGIDSAVPAAPGTPVAPAVTVTATGVRFASPVAGRVAGVTLGATGSVARRTPAVAKTSAPALRATDPRATVEGAARTTAAFPEGAVPRTSTAVRQTPNIPRRAAV